MTGASMDYLIRGALCVVIGVFGALTWTKPSNHALFSFDAFAILSMAWFFFLHASSPWGWDCPDNDSGHCRAEGWYPIDILTTIPVAWMWMSHMSQPFPVLHVSIFFWAMGQTAAQLASFRWHPLRDWTFTQGVGQPQAEVALGLAAADLFVFVLCMLGVISGRKRAISYSRLSQQEDVALSPETPEHCCWNPMASCCAISTVEQKQKQKQKQQKDKVEDATTDEEMGVSSLPPSKPPVEFRRNIFLCTVLTLALLIFRLLEAIDAYSPMMSLDRSLFHASMHALAVSGLYWHAELHRCSL